MNITLLIFGLLFAIVIGFISLEQSETNFSLTFWGALTLINIMILILVVIRWLQLLV
jgi:hypothetical protein